MISRNYIHLLVIGELMRIIFLMIFSISCFAGTLSVSEEASVKMVPDRAKVSAQIVRVEDTPERANKKVQEIYNKIEKTIENNSKIKITSGSYRVAPKYEYVEGKRVHRGYETSLSFELDSGDFSSLIDSIDELTKYRVNMNTFSPYLSQKQIEILKEESLIFAVKKAKRKADIMAKSSGVKLKKIIKISDERKEDSLRPMPMMEAKSLRSSNIKYTPKEQEISSRVYIEYLVE